MGSTTAGAIFRSKPAKEPSEGDKGFVTSNGVDDEGDVILLHLSPATQMRANKHRIEVRRMCR